MATTLPELRIAPGARVQLARRDADATPHAPGSRTAVEAELPGLHARALALHDRLWAEAKRSVLIVLQGIDTAGKDGTITHVFRGLNPQGTRVTAFKQPNTTELAHDFLWRVHAACPRCGQIGIFNRSHYEDVIAPRVHHLVPEEVWRERYQDINNFERFLDNAGTTIVKVFLQISKKEQRVRLEERVATPEKRWKLSPTDFAERKLWSDYEAAYDEMLTRTSTEVAPWWVIPSNHKWYRNWAVSTILIEVLEGLDPKYPEPPDLAGLHFE